MLRFVWCRAPLYSFCFFSAAARGAGADESVTRYVRFQSGSTIAYGIVEGDRVRQLDGNLFGEW